MNVNKSIEGWLVGWLTRDISGAHTKVVSVCPEGFEYISTKSKYRNVGTAALTFKVPYMCLAKIHFLGS
jgi:hypothetical protein